MKLQRLLSYTRKAVDEYHLVAFRTFRISQEVIHKAAVVRHSGGRKRTYLIEYASFLAIVIVGDAIAQREVRLVELQSQKAGIEEGMKSLGSSLDMEITPENLPEIIDLIRGNVQPSR